MGTMSDSQFEFEYDYDEDFDDASADEYQNDDHDSGMEEKARGRSSDTDTDIEITRRNSKTISSSHTPSNKSSNDTLKTYKASMSRRAQSDPHYRKPKKTAGSNKGASARPMMSNNTDNSMKRVLSASRKKTTKLHNVIYELQQQCEALTIENKDLKRNVRMQDRDLRKLDGTEAQLPMLMKRHGNEMNVLLEKYKKQKEVSTSLSENLKRVDMELLKTKDKLKEYQSMVKEKNLGERIELRDNIVNLEKVIEEKESKIVELNRSITLQKKAHSRNVKEKNERNEKALQRVKALEEANNDLLARIKNCEKALDVNNIYSHRKQKDDKQMVLVPPQDITPSIEQKDPEENAQIIQRSAQSCTKNKEEELACVKSIVGERIDTMVSRTDSHDIGKHSDETGTTFLTEGKLKMEETDEFYNVNDSKEVLITNTGNIIHSVGGGSVDMGSLGEQELHEKLDEMNEKRNENKNLDFMNNTEEQHSIKVEASKEGRGSLDVNSLDEQELHEKLDEMNEKSNKNKNVDFANNMEEKHCMQASKEVDEKEGELLQSHTERTAVRTEKHENEVDLAKSDELSEDAKARKLLLAKMRAIDDGKNPNDVTESSLNPNEETSTKKSKPNKKPIFLESSVKHTTNVPVSNTETKSLNSTSNSISKPRTRQIPDSSAAIEDIPIKTRDFNKRDENLHKGLPSHTNTSPELDNDFQNSIINANKNRVNTNQDDIEYNMHSRYDASYSPTVIDSNAGRNRRDSKKSDVSSLFGQFDDPFRKVTKNSKQGRNFKTSDDDLPVNKEDEQTELIWRTNKNPHTLDPVVVDDLEEMFIL